MVPKQDGNTISAVVAWSVNGIVQLTIFVPQERGAKPKELKARAILSASVGKTIRKDKLKEGEEVQVYFPAGIKSTGRIESRKNGK